MDACPPTCTLHSRHPHTESVATSTREGCQRRQRAVCTGAHGPPQHPEGGCDCYRGERSGQPGCTRQLHGTCHGGFLSEGDGGHSSGSRRGVAEALGNVFLDRICCASIMLAEETDLYFPPPLLSTL